MHCRFLVYDGGNYNCFKCSLCGKTWDCGDEFVYNVCEENDREKCIAFSRHTDDESN